MFKKVSLVAVVSAVMLIVQGCATGLSSTQYAVDIVSKQPSRHFKIINRKGEYIHQAITPNIVVLKAQSDFFKNEEYKVVTDDGKKHPLTATLTPIYWGNFFGFIGFAVDGFTGAMWALPSKFSLDKPENKDDVLDRL